jgi:UDP-N-acetylglucosamine--N-acetylmuramyl-(pentapeptide) pyrophosphoryl-undecaprenol N-acetylglucosamine transferase
VVVFSGGGTGGHLYPAIAIADALRERRPDVRVVFVGARRGLEARVLRELEEEHYLLPIQGVDRSRPLSVWRPMWALLASIVRLVRLFARLRPEAVVVTGGYAGAPSGVLAGLQGVPLVLQEQNAVPGLVTAALARWAVRVHVAFPEVVDQLPIGRGRVALTGNPARMASPLKRDEARSRFDLSPDAFVVLIVGGSQGSLALNRVMIEGVRGVADGSLDRPEHLHLLWATGPRHHRLVEAAIQETSSQAWVRALPYIEDMPAALAAGDLAVARAGAIFTAELLNQGLPAVLVPLPTAAADHQSLNAESLAAAGAALVEPEQGLTGSDLWGTLLRVISKPGEVEAMGRAALARARPHAAADVAADVAAVLPGPGDKP